MILEVAESTTLLMSKKRNTNICKIPALLVKPEKQCTALAWKSRLKLSE